MEPAEGLSTELRRESVGTLGLAAQSIGATGPEINAFPVAAVVTGFAGPLGVLAYLIASIVGVAFGDVIRRFANAISAAGGTYRFIRAGLGGPAGIFGGLVYFMGMFVFVPFTAVLSATVFSQAGAAIFPHSAWFANGHWLEIALVELVIVALLSHLGVRLSVVFLIGLSLLGMTSILILDLAILVRGGADGLSISGLMPWNVKGISFTSVAVALGLAMGGFFCSETPAFLAEEARNPKKTVPRAIIVAIVAMMAFLVINEYSVIMGLGVNHSSVFATQGSAIVLPLSAKYLAAWYGKMLLCVIGIACFTSVLALYNAVVRLLYDWGRERTIPARFNSVHGTHATPTLAIVCTGIASAVACFAGWLWQGDSAAGGTTLFSWALLAGVMWILVGYILVGASAIALQIRAGAVALPSWRRAALYVAPVVVIVGMALSVFSQIHPFPPPPLSSAPLIALVWLAVSAALAVLWRVRHHGRSGADDDLEALVESAHIAEFEEWEVEES